MTSQIYSWAEFAGRERRVLEKRTELLLVHFRHAYPDTRMFPVPIDELVQFAGLRVDLDDLASLGYKGAIGATFIADRQILIDEKLDPIARPAREGRYHYTLAHELAHWQLHGRGQEQLNLFRMGEYKAGLCRKNVGRGSFNHEEWEADYYAACLMMPRGFVLVLWERVFGHRGPLLCDRTCADLQRRIAMPATVPESPRWDEVETDWLVARAFAKRFRVSATAMKYRLEELRLLPDQQGYGYPFSIHWHNG